MADLRTLYPDTNWNVNLTITNPFNVLYVWNTNNGSPSNGGRCCLWTVPGGATWAKFEVWGGGGSGGGACCCQQAQGGGGAGSYARKTIRVVPGQAYTICAGGSSCCWGGCCGMTGYPSYACNPSATYPLCLCASGGWGGYTQCFASWPGCYSCISCICGTTCGHDFALCGTWGGNRNTSCSYDSHHFAAEPTYIGGGMRISQDHCRCCPGDFMVCFATFPGGGGGSANAFEGPCFCSSWGAGGLVVVTYK